MQSLGVFSFGSSQLVPCRGVGADPGHDLLQRHVITIAADRPTAQAVAIRGDRFAAIGTNDEVLKTAGPQTQKIDLGGKCVVPGIIESHVHPIGAALSEIDGPVPLLHSHPGNPELHSRRRPRSCRPDRLIFVPKVYSTRLAERRYPDRYEIDSAAPEREAMLDNGYAAVLNSALLKKAGITRDTPQPANGRIVKDAKGEPTGLILGAPQLLGKSARLAPLHRQGPAVGAEEHAAALQLRRHHQHLSTARRVRKDFAPTRPCTKPAN